MIYHADTTGQERKSEGCSTLQHTHSAHPAPDEDADAVQQLVEWRENAPYG